MLACAMLLRRGYLVGLVALSCLLFVAGPAAATSPTKAKPKPALVQPSAPAPLPGPNENPLVAPLGAEASILVNAGDGKVLWASNATVPRAPASLTKIMTALVVLRRANLDTEGIITPDANTVGGSETYAPVGTTMTVQDMLWSLLLLSGNDTAMALAHTVSPDGTVAGFATLMNRDALAYGATGSHFTNPHGLDQPGHLSTARDLALLTMVAMRNPTFAEMVGTTRHSVTWGGSSHLLINHNKLLTLYPGTIGVKTGYTDDSGNSLVSEVSRNGVTLLGVVLKAKSPAGYNDSEALYNWGFAHLDALEAKSTDTMTPNAIPALPRPDVLQAPSGPAADAATAPGSGLSSALAAQADRGSKGSNLPRLVLLAASMALWWYLGNRRRTRGGRYRAPMRGDLAPADDEAW